MTEEVELICFQIITSAGGSKSNYIQAIQEAKQGKYDEADRLIKEGDEMLNVAHEPHAKLLQMEAQGDDDVVAVLLLHAEDQMMSCEVFKMLAVELIEIYKKLDK